MSAADEERERNLALLKDGTEAYNRGDLGFAVQHAADDPPCPQQRQREPQGGGGQ